MNAPSSKGPFQTEMAAMLVVVVCLICASPGAVSAQDEGGGIGVELGFARVAEDYFLVPRLEAAYTWNVAAIACEDRDDECQTTLKLAGQVPLRLRVGDNAPVQDGVLREADWDEVSDWFRIIRRVEYGEPSGPMHIRFGPLGPSSIGHGTLIHDYYGVINVDHFHPGVTASLNTRFGGIETLVDDVTRPQLVGNRIFVRPAAFSDDESWWERVAVGGTFAMDVGAPTELRSADDGSIAVSDTQSPIVTSSSTTSFLGADAEVTVFDGEHFSLVPFVDYNAHLGFGSGLHAGSFLRFEKEDVSVELRGDYRQIWGQYIAGYFGPLYQVDRFSFSGWGLDVSAPKLRAAASIPSRTRRGASGGLSVNLSGVFTTELSYADHGQGRNESLRFRTVATPHERIQLGAFYFKQNFGALRNAFDLAGTLIATEARVDIYAPIYVFGAYGQSWRLEPSNDYVTVQDWELGVGASWRL